MIQNVIDGIVASLILEYPDCAVYTESVEQGLKEPCFSILCLNPSRAKEINGRYKDDLLFIIKYFPKSDEPYAECHEVCENLYQILELIKVDKKGIRGSNMSAQIVDSVLQFQVNYSIFSLMKDTKINMHDLNIKRKVVTK